MAGYKNGQNKYTLWGNDSVKDCPAVIKPFSCSAQLSMFVLLINLKLLTIANSFLLKIDMHENFSANNANANYSYLLIAEKSSYSTELSTKKVL